MLLTPPLKNGSSSRRSSSAAVCAKAIKNHRMCARHLAISFPGMFLRLARTFPAVAAAALSSACIHFQANGIDADVLSAIGNTPLIELKSLSAATGCRILAKAEHLNPGGSVKDRAARSIILEAEHAGLLVPRHLRQPGAKVMSFLGCSFGVFIPPMFVSVTTACRKRLALPQVWNAGDVSPTGRSHQSDSLAAAPVLSRVCALHW
jgi:hypothetical protein